MIIDKIRNETDYEYYMYCVDILVFESKIEIDDPIMSSMINNMINEIDIYEDQDDECIEFEKQVDALDPGITMLSVLMDQHKLKPSDFRNEIGSEHLVQKILDGREKLTDKNIESLSERFNIDLELFK